MQKEQFCSVILFIIKPSFQSNVFVNLKFHFLVKAFSHKIPITFKNLTFVTLSSVKALSHHLRL